ncbi:MAG: DNA topoisomerase IV [Flavobacteriaceae bacterium TMED265]|nr:MAG: DNA topoisomerase IV [Flavobacteriaceae bacterium TMED265]
MEENEELQNNQNNEKDRLITVSGMYQDWFLDYASYVILERAVPSIEDGFKPVQRRILHALKELDDGRYNKVANVVGHTMQYHPHGDASIADAMVQIGQKSLLIDTQGNWGNILTGDSAAASRYIEARLSKFALDVVFSPKITDWQLSYDGRKKEPIHLPVKFPLLLAQGAEGIAVGLSTKILPHNFNELIQASINYLKGKSFELFPDFPTSGIIDVTNYNEGLRGGKIRVRARIEVLDKTTLVIKEIPYGTNTSSLIDSILKANDRGKIKIKKIEDNTAADVEILVHLPNNISPDKTIDALYAFTNCEMSISPLACIIEDNKPAFISVKTILERSTDHTVDLLKQELNIRISELEEQWHFASLEKIFIEHRIYRDIEEEETWEGVISAIDNGLKPHIKNLKRKVTTEDIVRLTEIRIKRISKFDLDKAAQYIENLDAELQKVRNDLAHIIDYSIDYFTQLKKKYGKERVRKSEIKVFDDIEATKVVIRNTKLYVNRDEGFIGTSLKKDEYVTDCSDIDDIIVFTADGNMTVTKVDSKVFVGKEIIHVAVFKKKDSRTVYNMIYKVHKGITYIKRFSVTSVTRDKKYNLCGDQKNTSVLYFTANPNGEAEKVMIHLRKTGSVKKLNWELDFADLAVKGRNVRGNIVSKLPVKRVDFREKGISTLKPRKIWYDKIVGRLNVDERGDLLGSFTPKDTILLISNDGIVKRITPDLNLRIDIEQYALVDKFENNKPISIIYFDGQRERYFVKRFNFDTLDKEELLVTKHAKTKLIQVAYEWRPEIEIVYQKKRGQDRIPNEYFDLNDFIAIKSHKALGNQLTKNAILEIKVKALPYEHKESNPTNSNSGDLNLKLF